MCIRHALCSLTSSASALLLLLTVPLAASCGDSDGGDVEYLDGGATQTDIGSEPWIDAAANTGPPECEFPNFLPPDCERCAPGYAGAQCDECPVPTMCNDGNPCTVDDCTPPGTCTNVAAVEDSPCDDGDPCTVDDRCQAGVCRGDSIDCDDDVACTEDACLPGAGCVHTPVDARCVDADPCTEGGCDPLQGYQQLPLDGVPCSDGNPCTDEDRCVAGVCEAGPNGCACQSDDDCPGPADLCAGPLACDVAGLWGPHHTCAVDPARRITCEGVEAPACQRAACAPETGECVFVPGDDGGACDDGNVCTEATECRGGACVPTALLACDDGDPCTEDRCHFEEGCQHAPSSGARCSDGNPCTIDDVCAAGVCGGTPATTHYLPDTPRNPCVAGDSCEDGQLVPGTVEPTGTECWAHRCLTRGTCQRGECVDLEPLPAGTPCGTLCSDSAACDGEGRCVALDDVAACDDANPCTADACVDDECVHAPASGLCDDGDPGTDQDVCVSGRCVGVEPPRPCGSDADCTVYDDGLGCTGRVVCDVDGTRGGLPGTCFLDPVTIPNCHPWPTGSPDGIVATCVEGADDSESAHCEWTIADDSLLLREFQTIHKGAVTHFLAERLDQDGERVGHVFPGLQHITPVEGTCCKNLGGPDSDGDGWCDFTQQYFDERVWTALGFRSLRGEASGDDDPASAHPFVYSFEGGTTEEGTHFYEAVLRQNVDCLHFCQHRFAVRVEADYFLPFQTPRAPAVPTHVVHTLESDCPAAYRVEMGEIPLTELQQLGFINFTTQHPTHPRWAEAQTNLRRLLEGAVAAYAASPEGACAFPDTAGSGPVPRERTCCSSLGGPDMTGDNLCDFWSPPEETTVWDELRFSLTSGFTFVYEVTRTPDGFEATAYGDIDCDSHQSTFRRFARPVEGADGCEAEIVPGMFTERAVD